MTTFRIDADRLQARLQSLAAIGRTPTGGVTRLALSEEDREARKTLLEWASARGFVATMDIIGNLYIRRPGTAIDAGRVVTGSHLDTQRNGGNFDGIFGVLAGLEVLESLEDAGLETRHDLELIVWNNEEGVRFAPVTMGSGVFGGFLDLAAVLETRDADGCSVAEALSFCEAGLPPLASAPVAQKHIAYVEAHIEQGPLLEANGTEIGIVIGIQGVRQFRFGVGGRAAHAGTTPMALREDAFERALAFCSRLKECAQLDDPAMRFTIGRFELTPGAPNTVPSAANFTVDLRHPDAGVLRQCGDAMVSAAAEYSASVDELIYSPPVQFDSALCDRLERLSVSRGYSCERMLSGATHDARNVAHLGPTAMIFVPSVGGISHNDAEWTEPADIARGCQLLGDSLFALAG